MGENTGGGTENDGRTEVKTWMIIMACAGDQIIRGDGGLCCRPLPSAVMAVGGRIAGHPGQTSFAQRLRGSDYPCDRLARDLGWESHSPC